MRLLLDSHAFLWWLGDDSRLGTRARAAIASRGNQVHVSAASIWEIAIKTSLRKLSVGDAPVDLAESIGRCGFVELAVNARHAEAVRALPFHHADPFDRLLVAQARIEGLALVTADALVARYDVATLPAGR